MQRRKSVRQLCKMAARREEGGSSGAHGKQQDVASPATAGVNMSSTYLDSLLPARRRSWLAESVTWQRNIGLELSGDVGDVGDVGEPRDRSEFS
jgi:hypothetical protein